MSRITERLLSGRKESNQTKKFPGRTHLLLTALYITYNATFTFLANFTGIQIH